MWGLPEVTWLSNIAGHRDTVMKETEKFPGGRCRAPVLVQTGPKEGSFQTGLRTQEKIGWSPHGGKGVTKGTDNFEPRTRSNGRGGEWEMRSQRALEQESHSQAHEGAGAWRRQAVGLNLYSQAGAKSLEGFKWGSEASDISEPCL